MAATGEIAGIAADGGDPRYPEREGPIPPSNRLLHDPNVSFYEYTYYAKLTREEEEETYKTNPPTVGFMQVLFPTKSSGGVTPIDTHGNNGSNGEDNGISEKKVGELQQRIEISEAEWTNASRAVRTASGSACFYLITTDILGPFGIGCAFLCIELIKL
jgi:hypothetical protein